MIYVRFVFIQICGTDIPMMYVKFVLIQMCDIGIVSSRINYCRYDAQKKKYHMNPQHQHREYDFW